MTTIISIETSKYQLSTAFRCVLGAACLLVTVSLQGCRTAAISATALDLNNYQTGKTLPVGTMATLEQIAYTPSVISEVNFGGVNNGFVTQGITPIPIAVSTTFGFELGIAKNWQAGITLLASSTVFPLDLDAGFRGHLKTELTDSLSSFSVSILLGGGIQWGTASRTQDNVVLPRYGVPDNLLFFGIFRDTVLTMIDSKISSQVNRINLAIPMSWNLLKDSIKADLYAAPPEIDICITPGLQLVNQHSYLQDSSYTAAWNWRNKTLTKGLVQDAGMREIYRPYFIPSLSIGLNSKTSALNIFPEFTASWTNNGFTFGFGICIRQIAIKF
jgi:hypothetical protein